MTSTKSSKVEQVRYSTAYPVTVVQGEDRSSSTYGNAKNTAWPDDPLGDTPTLSVTLNSYGMDDQKDIWRFLLTDVRLAFDVNGGVHTIQVRLFENASADNFTNLSDYVWDSGSGIVEDRGYTFGPNGRMDSTGTGAAHYNLPRILNLTEKNKVYYTVDWSPAPSSSIKYYLKLMGTPMK